MRPAFYTIGPQFPHQRRRANLLDHLGADFETDNVYSGLYLPQSS